MSEPDFIYKTYDSMKDAPPGETFVGKVICKNGNIDSSMFSYRTLLPGEKVMFLFKVQIIDFSLNSKF